MMPTMKRTATNKRRRRPRFLRCRCAATLAFDSGYPHAGQVSAFVLTLFLHSGHATTSTGNALRPCTRSRRSVTAIKAACGCRRQRRRRPRRLHGRVRTRRPSLKAIADVLEAYEAKRWPEGKEPGGKG